MARSMKEVHTINYYPINEGAARRAKEMNSFSDYKEGSATAEYRAMVDKAAAIAEQQKSRVDPMYHEKIDHLLDTYARKLAENMNQGFAIDARVPSVLIAGPSNFPVGKKEKQNRARDSNMEEWRHIQGLLDKPYGSVGLIFLHHAPGKHAFVHHRGREQLVPAVPRPGRQKRPCGAFFRARESPRWCTKISPTEAWGLFFCITFRESGRLCTIPFGAASAFAQALRFSSRGPVTKNAPQERFLNAPADGAPETALRKRRAVFSCGIPGCDEQKVHHPLRGGFSVRAGAPLQRAGKALESPNKAQLYSWALNFSILQSHRIPY